MLWETRDIMSYNGSEGYKGYRGYISHMNSGDRRSQALMQLK